MQIHRLTISVLLLLFPVLILAQRQRLNDPRPVQEQEPEEQIRTLKNSILLVRLQLRERSLNQIREMGKNEYADQMEAKQKVHNKKIIDAFRAWFNFCPVYFFSSEYTQEVKEKNFDKIVFLSDDLTEDPDIKIDESKPFFIAEFDAINKGGNKYFSHYRYEESEIEQGIEKQPVYYGDQKIDFAALVLSDDQFIQLNSPFPYYTCTFEKIPLIERSIEKTVKRMNTKLYQYYYENQDIGVKK